MQKNLIQEQILELRKKLNQWNYEYYVLNKPSVSDYEFDQTLKTLKELEIQYPEFDDVNSPTKRVGGEASEKFVKRNHNEPMLSLENSYDLKDITAFYNNIVKQTGKDNLQFVCEPKIDGLSISCLYSNHQFIYGLTRGDGKVGEDVSNNLRTINVLPLRIELEDNFEARGEVYLPKHVLLELNQSENKFANTRNTASGALRNLDPKITRKRKLSALFYYIPQYLNLKFNTQYEVLQYLHSLKFPVALDVIKVVDGIDGIMQYIKWFQEIRYKLDYDVDGVVIKLNDRSLYEKLGTTTKFPKYAIAYKYPPNIAQTKLIDIIVAVGRTGKISFTAQVEPISINGSLIQYATLHNADYIRDNDIRINDIVNIYKAAEVIPRISSPVLSLRTKEVIPFEIPTTCPCCNSLLVKKPGEVDLYCVNKACKQQNIAKLVYFTSKEAMNIEGMSEATVNKLYDHHLLSNILDFFKLKDHYDEILALDLHIKHKMLNKLLANIENSKKLSLEHILTALGIKYVGYAYSILFAKQFLNIDHFMQASVEELNSIKDVGLVMAQSIYEWTHDESNIALINSLKEFGLNFQYIKNTTYTPVDSNNIYYNKTFAVTGKFEISRDELIKLIEQKYVGNVVSSINKSTNYLVLGKNPSSKLQKAKEWNIPIIEVKDLIND